MKNIELELSMKPDWKYAPQWANWLAMDRCGEWYWYEHEPRQSFVNDMWFKVSGDSRIAIAYTKESGDWYKSLEQRPTHPCGA